MAPCSSLSPEPPPSRIYVGSTTHFRTIPSRNKFSYPIYMAFIDVDSLCSGALDNWPIFSSRTPFALTSLLQRDHMIHADQSLNLSDRVRDFVLAHEGHRPIGKVYILTNLRILGLEFNPVSFYYILTPDASAVQCVVGEVHNIPWLEQHPYYVQPHSLPSSLPSHTDVPGHLHRFASNPKQFHVSPFMPISRLRYHWLFSYPADLLRVRISVLPDQQPQSEQPPQPHALFASVDMTARPWTSFNLLRMQALWPLYTLRIILNIMYEASKLFSAGFTFFPHPRGLSTPLSRFVEAIVALVHSVNACLASLFKPKPPIHS